MSSEERTQPIDRSPRCGHGELLTGDLEQEGSEQGHRRKILEPRPWVEIGSKVYEMPDHLVGVAKMGLGSSKLNHVFVSCGSFTLAHRRDLPSPSVGRALSER
jgi:hypothetical protein